MQQQEIQNDVEITEDDVPQSFKWNRLKEIWLPYIIALLLALCTLAMPITMRSRIEKDLANPVLTMAAILIAFIATSMTIILASLGLKAMKHLQSIPGLLKDFINYHTQSIWAGLATCGLSLVSIVVSDREFNFLHQAFFFVWSLCFMVAITTFIRVVNLLHRILTESL